MHVVHNCPVHDSQGCFEFVHLEISRSACLNLGITCNKLSMKLAVIGTWDCNV